jgi:hypothetical protein
MPITRRHQVCFSSSESDSDYGFEEEEEDEEDEEDKLALQTKSKKPKHTHVIVEVNQLELAIAQLQCKKCRSAIELKLNTVCIATDMSVVCTNDKCTFIIQCPPAGTTMHVNDRNGNYERNTDFAINVLFVLGFISMGDGSVEAARLLGLLGLPNDTTMESRSFFIIERGLGPVIWSLCQEILLENLINEVKLSMKEQLGDAYDVNDFNLWKASLTDQSIVIMESKKPKIDLSYDMAWQQKGSSHSYDSQSGHGTMMGRHTRKVVALDIKCKLCKVCDCFVRRKDQTKPLEVHHWCWRNHDGSSGAMEAASCLALVVDIYNQTNVVIGRLCCDNNSSVRADCQWSNKDYMTHHGVDEVPMVPIRVGPNKGKLQPRPDKGKLPGNVPEPTFVADPNHRRKGLTGDLIAL